MGLSYGVAETVDTRALGDLWFRAQIAGRPGPFATQLDSRRLIEERARAAKSWFYLAHDDEALVGMLYAAPGRAEEGLGRPLRGLVHFSMLAVEPARWRAGIGTSLVRGDLEVAIGRGYRRAQLWTATENEGAQRLFEHCGFLRTDHLKRDPRGGPMLQYSRTL